jgi:hypothetical protein
VDLRKKKVEEESYQNRVFRVRRAAAGWRISTNFDAFLFRAEDFWNDSILG